MPPAELCVIYNPASGGGRGRRRLAVFHRRLGSRAHFWSSQAPGQCEDLALRAAQAGYPTVAAAGGDGTVHEVANGLLRSGCPEVILAVLPLGSANDYAFSLGLDPRWLLRRDPAIGIHQVDVGLARSAGRQRYFVNGLGLGFNGAVTRESRRIRYLQGVPLYLLAMLQAVCWHFHALPMRVQLDDAPAQAGPTLALSLALGQREGNFVLAPDARLDDGLFDYIHAGALTRLSVLACVPGMITGRLPQDHPHIHLGRCRRLSVQAKDPLLVHLDGEFFCQPEDGLRELQAELLPRALRVWGRLQAPINSTPGSPSPTSPMT